MAGRLLRIYFVCIGKHDDDSINLTVRVAERHSQPIKSGVQFIVNFSVLNQAGEFFGVDVFGPAQRHEIFGHAFAERPLLQN